MSQNPVDALLSELLSDENDAEEVAEDIEAELGLSLETRLFDDAELEAALSSCAQTPPDVSDHGTTTAVSWSPEPSPHEFLDRESLAEAPKEKAIVEDSVTLLQIGTQGQSHELDVMEESVRSLVSDGDLARNTSVLDRIKETVRHAEEDWNPEGRPDAHGGMIGGTITLSTSTIKQPIANALQNEARYGTARVICQGSFRGCNILTAVGTSKGMLIVQLTLASNQGNTDYELFELDDVRPLGTITCLSCSPSSEKDKVLLSVGSAEGLLSIWDVVAKKCVTTINSHTSSICCLAFLAIRATYMLLSSDTKGAFHCHTLTSWVVRTSVSTRVLSEGNKQPLTFSLFPITRLIGDESDGTPDALSSFGEGMICLSHPNLCSVGRILQDSRLTIFYQIPKPLSITDDVFPVSSWGPFSKVTYAPHPSPELDGCIPYGNLCLSWGHQITTLNVPLLGDPSLCEGSSAARKVPLKLEPSDFLRLAHEISILTLAVWTLSEEDSSMMYLHWFSADELIAVKQRGMLAQALLFDKDLKRIDQVEIDDCPVGIVLRTGPAPLTSMMNTVASHKSQLLLVGSMGIKVCKLMEWEHAIALLTDINKWMMSLHLLIAFHCQAKQIKYLPSVGIAHLGTRDLDKINQSIASVLLQLLDWSMKPFEGPTSNSLISVAQLAMDICILTEQPSVLFEEVFPRFAASNEKELFLNKLERALSSNELHSYVPPEAMQSLVEYCCNTGHPEKVERCVLRMDIASLDLNQVIPLCIRHHLFIALLYIYNNSLLQDYITPALYLVNAIILSSDKNEAYKYGMNLLVYIRCCLRGDSYPPGFTSIDAERVLSIKQKMLGFMLFTKLDDLKKASQGMVRDSRNTENESSPSKSCLELTDPYPVLQCLLSISAELVIGLLKEALENWECAEKDLLEAYTEGKVEEMEKVRSVTQVIVDALVPLLSSFPEDKNTLMDYLSQCISSGRAVVPPDTALTLLEHLAEISKGNEREEYAQTREELLFCGIIKSVGIELDSFRNSTSSAFSYLEGQRALGLATEANLLAASALLHHLFQDYHLALRHYLLIGMTASTNPFTYFERSVSTFEEYGNLAELDKLKSAALSVMGQLAGCNPEYAAAMVMKHFPKDQEAVIKGLCQSRPLLFKYLRSAMDTALAKTTSTMDLELSSDINQLLTKSHCTLYNNLMCEFDPDSVLPFLQTFDHLVNVETCKNDCLKFGLQDAAAYLLEREGDIVGALKILIEKIQNYHKFMEKCVLGKTFDNYAGLHSRQMSLGAILRVSDFPDSRLHDFPEDVRAAQASLCNAVKLCRRSSLQRDKRANIDEKRRIETLHLWFSLLTVYIDALRDLPKLMKKRLKEIGIESSSPRFPSFSFKQPDPFADYPRLAYLRDIYSAFMDEVISAMADYVPLVDVAELIITEHANDPFGDFRSTLLGLINAYNYEQNILTTIRRLLSSDAYHVLTECYRKRKQHLKAQRENAQNG